MTSLPSVGICLLMSLSANADFVTSDANAFRPDAFRSPRFYLRPIGEIVMLTAPLETQGFVTSSNGEALTVGEVRRLPALRVARVYLTRILDARDRSHVAVAKIFQLEGLFDIRNDRLLGYLKSDGAFAYLPLNHGYNFTSGAHIADLVDKIDARTPIIIDTGALRTLISDAQAAAALGDQTAKRSLLNAVAKLSQNLQSLGEFRHRMKIAGLNGNVPLEAELLRLVENPTNFSGALKAESADSFRTEATRVVVKSSPAR